VAFVEIQNLRMEYRQPDGKPLTILNIPEFRMEPSEQLAMRGPSGSGKTTLLNIISGILLPSAGSVRFDGKDLTQLNEADRDIFRGQRIGFVFQTSNLLQGFTAIENVILGSLFAGDPNEEPSSVRARAHALLEKTGLAERSHHRPRTLSAGEQQRVAIARALMNKPRLILADEPTGSLDEKNGQEALALIQNLAAASSAAVLIVTHDPAVMAEFPKVVNLKELNQRL